ncbi:MAG: polyprenyl synthetase family protein, partial [Planctomycetia bacterium]|nr:polyprenyl synthetase family protein [Planctomycetia bacterium]
AAELALAAGAYGMVAGQALDMQSEASCGGDEKMLREIHLRKTAALVRASARMGAMAASASEKAVETLGDFGLHLGLAFQIADDVLDAEATTEALGKTAGKDARAGKLTYVRLYGVEESRRCAQEEAQRAADALSIFGAEAEVLRSLARFAARRDN